MADFAVSAAGRLIDLLETEIIRKICETWGYKSALKSLMETVSAIKEVLVDAEHERSMRELTNQERGYIQELKDAVYDADDLFDEFLTLAELKQIKTLSKVQRFFKKVLPMLSKLPHLKNLTLSHLYNLEYMEFDGSKVESAVVFHSLEFLDLNYMCMFRGWGMEEGLVDDNDEDYLLKKAIRFPRLSTLWISDCPNLMSVLCCPHLKHLNLIGGNERLKIITGKGNSEQDVELREVEIDKVCCLKLSPMSGINSLRITDNEVKCLSEVGDVFQSCASSLQTLHLAYLMNLRTLYGLNHHLKALKELILHGNEQLSIAEDNEEPWKSYLQNIHCLVFYCLPKMTSLPKGMQSLTSLQTLQIGCCENMKSLPEWISCLSSLHSLRISDCPAMKLLPEAICNLSSLKYILIKHCPELYNRYKEPDGVDFPKIQHIPKRDIY